MSDPFIAGDVLHISRALDRLESASKSVSASLERIADAIDRYIDADPMVALQEAMSSDPRVNADVLAQLFAGATSTGPDHPLTPTVKPQAPYASNGHTVLYKHPTDSRYEVVLRRDESAASGFSASIEEV